jgi:hypothetical protein
MAFPNIREEEKGKDLPRVETTTLVSHRVAAIAMMIFFLFQMAMLQISMSAWFGIIVLAPNYGRLLTYEKRSKV